LIIAVVLAVVIRPVLVGVVLLPVRLSRGERVFVLWSGLKGAVPIDGGQDPVAVFGRTLSRGHP
jgi:NhaP-type Na+/H+ and K+/H+ antiporter